MLIISVYIIFKWNCSKDYVQMAHVLESDYEDQEIHKHRGRKRNRDAVITLKP